MKKTLIALAALAATGATLAQSSVTIYGRMDLGMSQTDTTVSSGTSSVHQLTGATAPAPPVGGSVNDAFSLAGAQDQWTGSRIGFRGTEDLGGGLRAGFVYEFGINADRGAAGSADTATRLANLSLSGGFGTVVIGTFLNSFDTARGFSPANNSIPGGSFTQFEAAAVTERFDGRSQNAIAYVSPAFNGFTASIGFVNNSDETRNLNGQALGGGFNYDGFIVGLGFTQGPLRAQFAYGNLDVNFHTGIGAGTLTAPVNTDVTNWALGVSYNFGPAVVSFVYEDSSRDRRGPATGVTEIDGIDRNAWEIGARFPMGAFAPYVTFGEGRVTTIRAADGVRTRNDTSAWQIGTTYNLSARTWVYAGIGEAQRETADGLNVRNVEGYRLGLVHTF